MVASQSVSHVSRFILIVPRLVLECSVLLPLGLVCVISPSCASLLVLIPSLPFCVFSAQSPTVCCWVVCLPPSCFLSPRFLQVSGSQFLYCVSMHLMSLCLAFPSLGFC